MSSTEGGKRFRPRRYTRKRGKKHNNLSALNAGNSFIESFPLSVFLRVRPQLRRQLLRCCVHLLVGGLGFTIAEEFFPFFSITMHQQDEEGVEKSNQSNEIFINVAEGQMKRFKLPLLVDADTHVG